MARRSAYHDTADRELLPLALRCGLGADWKPPIQRREINRGVHSSQRMLDTVRAGHGALPTEDAFLFRIIDAIANKQPRGRPFRLDATTAWLLLQRPIKRGQYDNCRICLFGG